MKKINKSIISFVILITIGINTWFAAGFPSEPMVIYGNINWANIENSTLNITDWNNTILQSVYISDEKYGTSKTFDLDDKIILNEFEGNLQFKIDDTILDISDGTVNNCNWNLEFQKAQICEYNLSSDDVEKDTLDDMDNIPEEEKSEEFDDIFSWKVIEKTKEEVKQNIWDNIVSGTTTTWSIVIVNKAVDVDAAVTKDLVLISDSQKELVFIPKDTNTWNSDLVIEKPVKITSTSTIKSKINKDIFGAIEIPTNNQVNFDKDIRVCLDVNISSISGLKIYASHDNNLWFFDSSAKNLNIKNWQICFDVNHLTSFAVTKDIVVSSSHSGGGTSRSICEREELVCKQVWTKSYMRAVDESKCRVEDITEDCIIWNTSSLASKLPENFSFSSTVKLDLTWSNDIEVLESNITFSDSKSSDTKEYKLTSKKYITWVRTFISNKREVRQKYGLQVSYVKSDDEYNNTIDLLLKDINNNMKIKSIKQDMVKHIDTMSTSYAVANDDSVDEDLRKTFKAKLENDVERVQQKMKVLKRKDYIVNKALKERELRRLEQ